MICLRLLLHFGSKNKSIMKLTFWNRSFETIQQRGWVCHIQHTATSHRGLRIERIKLKIFFQTYRDIIDNCRRNWLRALEESESIEFTEFLHTLVKSQLTTHHARSKALITRIFKICGKAIL